jgi:hypothetical protein
VAAAVNAPGLSPSARLGRGEVVTRRTHDAVLLLPIASPSDEPVVLTGSAIAAWDTFEVPHTVDEVVATLGHRFDAGTETIRAAVAPLVA